MKNDAELRKDVLDELSWDPKINATEVGVAVKDGVVTLTGHLTNYAQKYAAERAAQRVSGVKALAVEIEVRLASSDKRSDTDIAAAAKNALGWSVVVPESAIQLKVEKGWITLNGEVEWDYQRTAADRAVRDLQGVVGVANLIKVKPHISPVDVQKKIQDALARQAEQEAKQVQVVVDGSRVTLRGKIHSWAERQAAQSAAWSAPGVSNVVNELSMSS